VSVIRDEALSFVFAQVPQTGRDEAPVEESAPLSQVETRRISNSLRNSEMAIPHEVEKQRTAPVLWQIKLR
jgi:hypothetical protein